MATESLSFDVWANDRASETFRRLGLQASNAAGDVGKLGDKLTKLGTRSATARVGLEGNKQANVELDKLDLKLIRLGNKVANPNITVEGKVRALADIAAVDLAMDRLNDKFAGPKIGRLSSLLNLIPGVSLGGGAAGAAGAGSGAGGGLSGLLGGAGPYAIGGLAALLATLVPSLLPVGLGVGVGALGAAGGVAVGAKDRAKLLALQKQLAGVTGTTASAQARRALLQNQIAAYQQAHGPQLAFGQAASGLLPALQSSFFGALTGRPVIQPGGTGPGTHGQVLGKSFLQDLIPIFRQIQRFIVSIGPTLGDLFRASVPYLKLFVGFMEQAAKTLLPVFTQTLREMTPFLPIFAKGLANIVGGLAGFLKAIGPSGMEASAKIFVALTKAMAAVLVGLGHTINWLTENIPTWVHDVAAAWDWLYAHTTKAFDTWRHGWAHDWDSLWNDTLGSLNHTVNAWNKNIGNWEHNTAHGFDVLRHNIAATWDATWASTVSTVRNGIGIVVSWFKGLPGKVIGALLGLGTKLWNLGHTWLTDLWNGIKSVSGGILGWFGGFISKVLGFLGKLTGHSPSGEFYFAGQKMMTQLAAGIKSRAHHAANAAEAAAQRVSSGALGGDALANQSLARRIFPWPASQWQPFVELVMAESGFDRFARNPSSGAYGIPQALPPTKMPFAAQAAGGSHAGPQLSWMFDYIRSIYGTPAGAWAHELSAHWYGSGLRDGIFSRPTLIGVGERGPERVNIAPLASPRGGGGAGSVTYNVNVYPGVAQNPREVGRQVVEVIKEFERGSGKGWRS